MITTMITLSYLFGNYSAECRSCNYGKLPLDAGALDTVYNVFKKHTSHTITGTNKIFQNPGANLRLPVLFHE